MKAMVDLGVWDPEPSGAPTREDLQLTQDHLHTQEGRHRPRGEIQSKVRGTGVHSTPW